MKFLVQRSGAPDQRFSFEQNEINVGREGDNDMVLAGPNVSKRHARILHRDGRFIVTDLRSANGTYVNGRKLVQATIVREGDIIYIGDVKIRCSASYDEAFDAETREDELPMTMTSNSTEPHGPMERSASADVFRSRETVAVRAPITEVVVHARGALVTRACDLPADLPGGTIELLVDDITPLAHAGGVRASLSPGATREIVQIETALQYSEATPQPGPARSRVREIEERIVREEEEVARLTRRRDLLQTIQLGPPIRTKDRRQVPRDAVDARFRDSLRIAELLTATAAQLDDALRAVRERIVEADRELEAARLEDAQASTAERTGEGRKTYAVLVRLRGEGPPGRLTVTYAVPAARFWPTYALRLSEGGKRASWSFEVIVAQRSGEDWTQAALSFSTGDLHFDARLPELASLRIGRKATPKPRAWRPPPEGVETMFAFYLAFVERRSERPEVTLQARARVSEPEDEDEESNDEYTPVRTMVTSARAEASGGISPPAAMMPMAAPMMARMAAPRPAPGAPMPMGARAGAALGYEGGGGDDLEQSARRQVNRAEPEIAPELAPSAAWDDYDHLVLARAEDARARGQLVVVADRATRGAGDQAAYVIDAMALPGHTDPLSARGLFDHRYDASGTFDVPSDGGIHRIPIRAAEGPSRVHHTTVPALGPEVYREALFANPFTGPLLAGPIEVYLDGTLLTTTPLGATDRGGEMRVGMGVDDRFKVARNVRTSEEAVGLIGGSLAVTNHVTIEITAALRDPVSITVLERVPVTDEKALQVELVGERPGGLPYDQAERGAPVRGGRRFELALAPGRKGLIELTYRLVFSNKLDIVGGGRRD